jgi:capsular polysaccharide biosynthesis protein
MYLSPPVACERLATIVSRFGGSMQHRGVTGRIEYDLPAHASIEVRDFLRPHASIELSSNAQAQLPGGRVYGSGNVLSPDGASIARDVSEDFGKPFSGHWLLTYRRIRPPQIVHGDTAVIATTLGDGYSHWLLEELPRLLSADLDGCTAAIANVAGACRRAAFRYHGFSRRIIPVKRDQHLQCERLIIPRLLGPQGHPMPEGIDRVLSFTESIGRASPENFGERLYISRAKTRRRHLSNDGVLWSRLEALGFRRLFLEELTWSQQINAFRAAREIVGPHGAGLANLVFCAHGTRVVELFNRAYINPCFWRVAALKHLDYRPLASAGDEPLAQDLRANRLDIAADLAAVMSALS